MVLLQGVIGTIYDNAVDSPADADYFRIGFAGVGIASDGNVLRTPIRDGNGGVTSEATSL